MTPLTEDPLEELRNFLNNKELIRKLTQDFNEHDTFIENQLEMYAQFFPELIVSILWDGHQNHYQIELDDWTNGKEDTLTLSLKEFLRTRLNNIINRIIRKLRLVFINVDEKQRLILANNLLHEADIILKINTEVRRIEDDILGEAIGKIQYFLKLYTTRKVPKIGIEKGVKVQWLLQLNQLTSLLLDLLEGTKTSGKAIKASRQILTDFVVNNFIDSDGNSIERNTIYTNLSKGEEKRAKNPIELSYKAAI